MELVDDLFDGAAQIRVDGEAGQPGSTDDRLGCRIDPRVPRRRGNGHSMARGGRRGIGREVEAMD